MKTVWTNFVYILSKFKLAAFLNLAGFTVALVAFIIIMMQLRFEYTFESCHPNTPRIYRIEGKYPNGNFPTLTRPYAESVIKSSPYIKAGGIIAPYSNEYYFTLENEPEQGYKELLILCTAGITEIFNFDMIAGNKNSLYKTGNILIPESMAKKLFKEEYPIGKQLYSSHEGAYAYYGVERSLEIGGVYRDFPANTQMENAIYIDMGKVGTDDWGSVNYLGYILLEENAVAQDIQDNFNASFDHGLYSKVKSSMVLTPLKDIYFLVSKNNEDIQKGGNKDVSSILLITAFLIIVIAAINYTNFSTSLAPMRMKSINTQKVLGATESSLRRVLLSETLLSCLIAFCLAIFIIHILNKADYISFLDADLRIIPNLSIIMIAFVISCIIGVIAGWYPSFYITKFPPALVLKGSHGLSPSGRKLRLALVSFQFVISFILIISAFFIHAQNRYMRDYNTGFDTDQIAVCFLSQKVVHQKDVYQNKLKENPFIEDVAFSMFKFGGSLSYMNWGGMSYRDKQFHSDIFPVSWNFPDVMGIRYEGNRLIPTHGSAEVSYMLPNLKLKEELEMELNTRLDVAWASETGYNIPAFTDNVNPKSLRYEIDNSCFLIGGSDNTYHPHSYIKIKPGGNMQQIVSHIQKTIKTIDPIAIIDIEFFDTIYNDLYQKEQNLSKLIFLFSLLAIIISVSGIFSLVMFDTQYKYKEIGIRKVHGASIARILWMFNRYYTIILLVCFILAVPIAWYGVNEWLKNFAYKVPFYWWVYALALLIVSGITLFTVTYQTWKAAALNPTESLKTE